MENQVPKRGRNFTECEKNTLVDICSNFKHTIENKKTDGTSVKEKTDAWNKIMGIYNASSETGPRTAKQLRALYDMLKQKARKDNHNDRVEKYKTGGGTYTPKVNDTGAKILAMLAPQFQPLESSYDCSAAYYGDEVVVVAEEMDLAQATESESLPIADSPESSPSPVPPSLQQTTTQETPVAKQCKRKLNVTDSLLDTIKNRKASKTDLDLELHKKKMQILDLEAEAAFKKVTLLNTEQNIKDVELKIKMLEYERL